MYFYPYINVFLNLCAAEFFPPSFRKVTNNCLLKCSFLGDAWVAQSVKHPTLAQVTISRSVSSSPASGSVLMAQSLEPASHSASPSLSAPPLITLGPSLSLSLSLSLSQKQTLRKI